MEFKAQRKFINRVNHSRMVSIPPYFLDAMEAMDCKSVIIRIQDQDHLILELVRVRGNQ